MTFYCPACKAPRLEITGGMALPPDNRSDEIMIQVLACGNCEFRAAGVYEESRRGSLDDEAWEHTGFPAPVEVVEELRASIQRCPMPHEARCACPSHQRLGTVDAAGRWNGLDPYRLQQPFALILAMAS